MLTTPIENISDSILCDLYRMNNSVTMSDHAKYFYIFFGIMYEIINVSLCLIFTGSIPLIGNQRENNTGLLHVILIFVILIVVAIQKYNNNLCWKTIAMLYYSTSAILWFIICIFWHWINIHIIRTEISNQWQCLKFILWTEIINENPYFRHRINYLLIPLIHIGLVLLQYSFVLCTGSLSTFFYITAIIEIFISASSINYTSFYYQNQVIVEENVSLEESSEMDTLVNLLTDNDLQKISTAVLLAKIISIIVTNALQLFLYINYRLIYSFLPIVVS